MSKASSAAAASNGSSTITTTIVPSYASRLQHNPNKGVVGLPEVLDSPRMRKQKLGKLVRFMKEAKKIVCLTGAGISTSAGIADFRGPNGVWTKEEEREEDGKKKSIKRAKPSTSLSAGDGDSSFEQAQPTRTHKILTELNVAGIVHFVISQNVDGLHLRSKFPRKSLIELHGNVFLERCAKCGFEVFHDKDLGGVGCRSTGKKCTACQVGDMHDTVLDWDTPIDDDEMASAEREVSEADLVLCLGTSLRIVPAAELPLLVGSSRTDDFEPRICIVNLQATPLDNKADLVVHCPVDEVMSFLASNLLAKS